MKYITTILMLISMAFLAADPTLYPTTTLVENFGATWCGACEFALDGLDVVASQVPEGELIYTRLLTESGEYSTPEIDARFSYYDVQGLPAVIFNGKTRVDGSGDGIADGTSYMTAANHFRYQGSPIRMQMPTFVAATGVVGVDLEMLDPDVSYTNAKLVYYLLEDNVTGDLTHILRDVVSEDVSISYTGSVQTFDTTFAIDYSWNVSNLWAAAFIQLETGEIIQSVSSKAMPQYRVQSAMPFGSYIYYGYDNTQYESPAFYIWNLGADDTYTRHIEVISAPPDWYFNYCDVDGNCYPGSVQIPFSLASGTAAGYDLNISIGTHGTAYFNFVISSPNISEYKIPFVLSTVLANDDATVAEVLKVRGSHPNPFQDQLSFEIDSAKHYQSKLDIFNVKGQKVQTIALPNLVQGTNSISWDAADLPNGVYFYRLEGSASTGKILKVK